MASVLEVGLFGFFDVIFTWLLIFTVVFALFQKTGFLAPKGSKTKGAPINAMIAVAVATLAIIYPPVVELINFIAPWFVLAFIFLVLLLMVFKMFGVEDDTFVKAVVDYPGLLFTIIGVSIVILVAGFGAVFGQTVLELSPNDGDAGSIDGEELDGFEQNVVDIIFHPAVLGMGLLMTIAFFAVIFLTGDV